MRLAAVMAVGLLLAGLVSFRVSQAATPAIEFVPGSVSFTADARTATMDLRVTGAHDLGAYEIELAFDPAVVIVDRVDRVVGTAEQTSPNREWVTLPDPSASDTGYTQLSPGVIVFGGYSYGANNPPGLDGDVTLARLHLRGIGDGSSALHLNRVEVPDTQAAVQSPTGSDASVSVSGILRHLFLPMIGK